MTDEELAVLQQEISGEFKELLNIPEDKMTRKERKHRLVLRARRRALEKLAEARKSGNVHAEIKAGLDYGLLTEYGERNIFLYNIMKARLFWWRGI